MTRAPPRGQWDLADAYRYISEAYGGYHINALNGINIQAGIFMSYIGLWSYYQADNWTYQPSYVSSNTPWFFNGARIQIFPTDKLKIEPWLVNGWQSRYGRVSTMHQVAADSSSYRPNGWLAVDWSATTTAAKTRSGSKAVSAITAITASWPSTTRTPTTSSPKPRSHSPSTWVAKTAAASAATVSIS